jgi:hypothetical protein
MTAKAAAAAVGWRRLPCFAGGNTWPLRCWKGRSWGFCDFVEVGRFLWPFRKAGLARLDGLTQICYASDVDLRLVLVKYVTPPKTSELLEVQVTRIK